MDSDKTYNNKKLMIAALEEAWGVVTMACKNVGMSRQTHYEWYREDEAYKLEVDSVPDTALDLVESELFKQIQNGEVSSTIFYLKCKGKKRGYIEKTEIDLNAYVSTTAIITGTPPPDEV